MVGGGSRRGVEEVKINSGNVFAALETLKKKKKKPSDKAKGGGGGSKNRDAGQAPPQEKEVFWAPTQLAAKSWADVEDDDDEDFYANNLPPRPVWGSDVLDGRDSSREHAAALEEEIESEDDGLDDEVDDDAEDEPDHEAEEVVPAESTEKKATAPPAPPKDTERQLSKKELKKKELAELDAVLAELGLSGTSSNATQDETNAKKGADQTGDAPAPSESKSSKKKKAKKDKSSKEVKEAQEPNDGTEEAATAEPDEDMASVDVKDRLKKVALVKKKKSGKEVDTAAKIAATEAAARSARLAAAKKKEKNHYNQQPVR